MSGPDCRICGEHFLECHCEEHNRHYKLDRDFWAKAYDKHNKHEKHLDKMAQQLSKALAKEYKKC